LGMNTWRSRVDVPGRTGAYVSDSRCHDVVSVYVTTRDPTTLPALISLNVILIFFPAESARTQMLPPYVPACVVLTQFGTSFRTHFRVPVLLFLRSAAPPPVCVGVVTRVRATPVPDPVMPHPAVSV
jgi:hypothetical protein